MPNYTRMVFSCSCGVAWEIGDAAGMESHIDLNPNHVASEGYVAVAYPDLPAVKDRWISEIKIHRDRKRLVFDLRAEYPAGRGNMFSCSAASQDNWSKLATLDAQGAVVYPSAVPTYDGRGTYNIVNTADREAATLAIATVVITERANAEAYIQAVLAAVDETAAETAAAPYLAT